MAGTRTHTENHPISGARERVLQGLPVTERRLKLNGIMTAVLEGGDGPPIVLLHGPGEYGAAWRPVITSLVTRCRVIAPDLPGHGTTDPVGGELDRGRILGWLDDLIERTCTTPPTLVGQVLGGSIAANFACDRGDRICGLVLVNALGLAAFQPPPDFGIALGQYLAEPNEVTHDSLWSQCAFDYDAMRRRMGESWDWIKAYNVDRTRTPALQGTLPNLMKQFGMQPVPAEDLARIAVPVTLIWARHHRPTPVSVAQSASAAYGWPLHVIEDAGDAAMEQPELFLDALHAALIDPKGGKPRS